MQLSEFIKLEGWSDYGVILYPDLKVPLEKHREIFENWVKAGYMASMDYLDRMKADRFNPSAKLIAVRSILVLVATYSSGDLSDSEVSGAQVARYAVGKDYHDVLRQKLLRLSDFLKTQNPTVETYLSVDSGPTVDRLLAQEAGLGFFGKNSMLINPSRGSFFFIASLMTNLELPPTPKKRMPNCGNCTKCVDVCPTGAIVAPGVIDARRCISYLTIENKEGIPVEFRKAMGNHLFGCDDCQICCPFNVGKAGKQTVLIDSLEPSQGVGQKVGLREVLEIQTDEAFRKKFAGTPLMRPKRRGLLRNACIVAGNSGDISLIPVLEKVLYREADIMLKEHAQWAIAELMLSAK